MPDSDDRGPGEEQLPEAPATQAQPSVSEGGAGGTAPLSGSPEETETPEPAADTPPRVEAPPQAEAGGEKPAKPKRSPWAVARETVILLLIAAVIAVGIQAFFIRTFLIPSSSMSHTLEVDDRVLVEKVTYWFRDPKVGDIIVFRYPPRVPAAMDTNSWLYWPFEQIGEILRLTHRGTEPYVKRVVGTGGDTVELRKGELYVNGKHIVEKYKINDGSNFGPVTVPKDMLFCMGDNRPNSRDSRYWGFVSLRSVIGKVVLIWWPLSRFGIP